MNKPNARTYGGITVAHFGGSGDIRTNLTSAELTDLEILVGDFDVKTALVMGAELEPLTIALHYISGARATAGVGAFGSWHDPYGPRAVWRGLGPSGLCFRGCPPVPGIYCVELRRKTSVPK